MLLGACHLATGEAVMVSVLEMIVLRAAARTPARWRGSEPALAIRDEPQHTERVRGGAYAAKPDHPVPALPSGYSRPYVRGAQGLVQGRTFPPPYSEPRSLTAWPHEGRQWAQARAGTSGNYGD